MYLYLGVYLPCEPGGGGILCNVHDKRLYRIIASLILFFPIFAETEPSAHRKIAPELEEANAQPQPQVAADHRHHGPHREAGVHCLGDKHPEHGRSQCNVHIRPIIILIHEAENEI